MFRDKKIRGSGSIEEDGAEDVNIELILAAGIERGLRKQDADTMTIGMWIDYIIEWNNLHSRREEKDTEGKPVKTRRATQADFNNF